MRGPVVGKGRSVMTTTELLNALKAAGIVLQTTGDRLMFEAPKGAMTPRTAGPARAPEARIAGAAPVTYAAD